MLHTHYQFIKHLKNGFISNFPDFYDKSDTIAQFYMSVECKILFCKYRQNMGNGQLFCLFVTTEPRVGTTKRNNGPNAARWTRDTKKNGRESSRLPAAPEADASELLTQT